MGEEILLVTFKIQSEMNLTTGFYLEKGSTIKDLIEMFNYMVPEPYTFSDCICNNSEKITNAENYVLRDRSKLDICLSKKKSMKLVTFNVYKKINKSEHSLLLQSLLYGAKKYNEAE